MSGFPEFLHSLGLVPRTIAADGQPRRCATESHPKKRNGAYMLAPDRRFGWAQDWAIHSEVVLWFADKADAGHVPAPPDRAEIRRREAQARAERLAATAGARAYFNACTSLLGGHPYLDAKGLTMVGCRGLRIDHDGWLVVPMGRDGQLASIQRISPTGDKRFWPGAATSGASYTIERHGAPMTVLCEGLATGLAIYAAAPLTRVVVAFNSGNMPRVAAQIPRRGMGCVAADNDYQTESRIGRNPGMDAARAAAEVLGCGVAVPDCIGTDFADMLTELMEAFKGFPDLTPARRRQMVDSEIRMEIQKAATLMRAAA